MPNNPLLAEFIQTDPTALQPRITDTFDGLLSEEEEAQIAGLKDALIQALEERIDALD
jgi:hypothetical protein